MLYWTKFQYYLNVFNKQLKMLTKSIRYFPKHAEHTKSILKWILIYYLDSAGQQLRTWNTH